MRLVAILATYNEERFIDSCLNHLIEQGAEIYLLDNESEDRTREIAEHYLGRGLIDIEIMPRHGVYSWRLILQRKEQIATEIEADWCMHVDADEVHLSPDPKIRLVDALMQVEAEGFNAVNFMEFTFVPTREVPDHDHPDFAQTMRWYYPFLPSFPHRLNAWKKQENPVDLAGSGGHQVCFPGLKMHPISFLMKHYLFLSHDHARRKYTNRTYDTKEVAIGWHGARASLQPEAIILQSEQELRYCDIDNRLDPSDPLRGHPIFSRIEHGT